MSIAITNSANYALKPTSVRATRKTVVIPTSNATTFAPDSTAIFYLPSLRNQVMDGQSGYLRFTATITGAGFTDVSAHALIERIMTYGPGGQLISDIQNYNVLATMMLDLQISQSEKIALGAALGTESVLTVTNMAGNSADTTAANMNAQLTVGLDLNRRGMNVADGTAYSFAIPLIHPLFAMSEKTWPAFACADDIRLEVTWSSIIKGLVASTNFSITNPEIFVDYIEFDSAVLSLIQQTYAGRDLVIPSQDYRYYASQIASGTTGQISQIVPAKQMSARAMFFAFRPAETQVQAGYTCGCRVNPFRSANDNFRLNIGGVSYPQRPIITRVANDFAPWFASTQTALHAFNHLSMNGAISRAYYNAAPINGTNYAAGAGSFRSAFALGINLDTLRGQSETQNSGLNLANVTTYYEGFLAAAARDAANANNQAISVDAYVLYDCLFVIDAAGNCSLRF